MSYIRHFYRFLFVLILFISGLGTSLAMAQVVGGTIAGDVVDPAGERGERSQSPDPRSGNRDGARASHLRRRHIFRTFHSGWSLFGDHLA